MWKFHNISIIQILCEINFWDTRSAKTAILTHLEALNFNFFHEFLHFLKAQIDPNQKFRGPEITKMAFF